ncbi:hypothetical protein ES706_04802 [subsurface metagenome]
MYLPPYIRDIHGTVFPPSPIERELFYRDDLHAWYQWNGAGWVNLHNPTIIEHGNEWHNPNFATEAALSAHIATTGAGIHGSTVVATPHRLVHRDAAGRSQIANPAANPDIDNLGARDAAIAAHKDLTTGVHGVGAGAVVGTALTQTLTNKTLIATTNVVEEIRTFVSTTTPIPTGGSLRNFFTLTALLSNATFVTPSGTPVNGNKLIIRVKDNGTTRTLGWDAIYRAMEFALPTDTTAGKTMYLGFIYNSADSKWDMVAINQEA